MNTYQKKIEQLFIYYILLQPILDLIAYTGIPLSEPVRGLALLLGGCYILMASKHRIYFLTIAAFLFGNLVMNYFLKPSFDLVTEVNFLIKTAYFFVMLGVYGEILSQSKWRKKVSSFFVINLGIIAIVMILAELTSSGQRSYGMLAKEGHTGWFFSGNELSAITAMGIVFLFLGFIQQTKWQLQLFYLVLIAATGWAMMTIGTKVSFGALILACVAMITWLFIESFKKKSYQKKITPLLLLLVGMVLFTPLSAIGHNLNISYPTLESKRNPSIGQEEEPPDRVPVQALNGREAFFQESLQQYQEAPLLQQLFGLGYAGNYQDEPKLIEMDFIDWFIAYGIIGFLILLIPIIYSFYRILSIDILRKVQPFMLFIAIGLGLGSAALAGHVLSSPAASIYLAALFGLAATRGGRR
ncbi:O-antigen ligase family protein [Gracilibacillus timonensis]|uniref:O-antigen ligase family protein n=1 Tax=Gracilibacillus timonensis TaxID=1816696 RepID=UPI0008248287|nr:O-antigen ligase family protein [Gracilibacillus timonensis]